MPLKYNCFCLGSDFHVPQFMSSTSAVIHYPLAIENEGQSSPAVLLTLVCSGLTAILDSEAKKDKSLSGKPKRAHGVPLERFVAIERVETVIA